MKTNITPYSPLDRALHNLAFGSSILQSVLADIETGLYAKSWQQTRTNKPIFITSLPRAGTTIILEALYRLPNMATHTYRDMPFILTPVLWSKLSSRIQNKSIRRERAHGDGLVVSEDSPEAFEEVLWKKCFPINYSDHGINLWDASNKDFSDYFHQHMRKIVFLRQPQNDDGRYVSKNNGNIARIGAIKLMFPDSFIIVPLRNPIEHAISMWRQHKNFLRLHASDKFTRKYMADIGHYEFGHLHLPILFPGISSLIADLNPEALDYWVAYWIVAFEYLAEQDGIIFVSYEKLCQSPVQGLKNLCDQIELSASRSEITSVANIFKAPPEGRKQCHNIDNLLIDRANMQYKKLLPMCLSSK